MKTPQEFVDYCKRNGVEIARIQKNGGLITLTKAFQPGDKVAFGDAESDVSVIYEIPTTAPGSIWGTDGASVGGYSAVQNGLMKLSRSGCSKRWLAQVAKLI